MEPIEARPTGIAYCFRVGDPLALHILPGLAYAAWNPCFPEVPRSEICLGYSELKEEFDANEETKRRGVPIVYTNPVDRGVTIVTLVGHFCVHRELFGEHVVGAPAESPGQVITG